jgi:PAS domain-containing protein
MLFSVIFDGSSLTERALVFIISLGAAAGVLWGIWVHIIQRRIIQPLTRGWNRVSNGLTTVEDMRPRVESIEKELSYNGGGSTKDAIRRMDKKMGRVEERQRLLMWDIPSGQFETDHKGGWVSVNKMVCTLIGQPPEKLIEWGWVSFIDQRMGHKDSVMTEYHHCLQDHRDFIHNVKFKNGVELAFVASPMFDTSQVKVIGMYGSVMHATETDSNGNKEIPQSMVRTHKRITQAIVPPTIVIDPNSDSMPPPFPATED